MSPKPALLALIAISPGAAFAQPASLPPGVTVGPSGFATLETAPPSPFPGWPLAPEPRFSEAVSGPAVAEGVRPLIRAFPQSDRALGATNQALLGGRIALRDGCFYVTRPGRPDRLAYFGREVALGLDGQGHLALSTRDSAPRLLGRVGETFSWGGPIAAPETLPMVAELRARCGDAPLEHVGIPRSSRLFRIRLWVIDSIAHRHRIARGEAWRRFRACLEAQEARTAGLSLDCDTI